MKARLPIRSQLLCLVLSIFVPLMGLFIYIKYEEATDDINNVGISTLNIAHVTAASIEQFLGDSQTLLAQIAQRALDHEVVSTQCSAFLSDFRELPYPYTNLLLVDTTGRMVCSAGPLLLGQFPDFGDRQWFQSVARNKQFTVGDPVISRITGNWI